MTDELTEGLLVSLADAAIRVEAAVRVVPGDRWDEVIHTGDGAWTRRQLLGHMAANDLRQLVRVRIGAGIPQAGDDLAHAAELEVHDWNRARVAERAGLETDQLVDEIRENRSALIALLRGLTPEQRARPMPFRGEPTPLDQMVPVLIGHLDEHASDSPVLSEAAEEATGDSRPSPGARGAPGWPARMARRCASTRGTRPTPPK